MSDTLDTEVEDDGGLSFLLEGFAGIQAEIGQMAEEARVDRTRKQALEIARLPIDTPLFASAQANAAGQAVINLGAPAQGRQWEIRRLGIGGVTPSTAAAGTADLYEFAGQINAGNLPGMQGWIQRLSALPGVSTFSTRQAVIHEGVNAQVLILGGTANQIYIATGLALDYQIRPERTTIST